MNDLMFIADPEPEIIDYEKRKHNSFQFRGINKVMKLPEKSFSYRQQ